MPRLENYSPYVVGSDKKYTTLTSPVCFSFWRLHCKAIWHSCVPCALSFPDPPKPFLEVWLSSEKKQTKPKPTNLNFIIFQLIYLLFCLLFLNGVGNLGYTYRIGFSFTLSYVAYFCYFFPDKHSLDFWPQTSFYSVECSQRKGYISPVA